MHPDRHRLAEEVARNREYAGRCHRETARGQNPGRGGCAAAHKKRSIVGKVISTVLDEPLRTSEWKAVSFRVRGPASRMRHGCRTLPQHLLDDASLRQRTFIFLASFTTPSRSACTIG